MSDPIDSQELLQKLASLEALLRQKDEDLNMYRKEILQTNQRLASLTTRLQNDLQRLQSLQRALVPTEIPNISGVELSSKFVPSLVMGGDYFDIFEHQDPMRFGLLMAAASGHATSALLLSILLKLFASFEAKRLKDPFEVVRNLQNEISDKIQENECVDIAYGVLDRRDFSFQLCSAGRIAVVYQIAPQGKVSLLPSSGGPLGPKAVDSWETQQLVLNPKDRLVFCSPGISDSTNFQSEIYGRERLAESVLSAPHDGVHSLRNHVLMQLEKFTNSSEPQRDRTVIAMEVKDRVIKLAR